jgi:hypothetical protein
MSYLSACVVLSSVTHVHAQEMDMTPQLLFGEPITPAQDTNPSTTSPPAQAPTPPPPPAAAASPWQKSTAFQLRPPLEGVNYGWQTALAYLMPIPMVPLVHGLHGNLGRGFLGVLGFYGSALAGAGAGYLLTGSGSRDATTASAVMLGLVIGAIAWVVFDVNTLSVEDPPPPAGRLQPFVYERH